MRRYSLVALTLLALFFLSTAAMAQQHQQNTPRSWKGQDSSVRQTGPFSGLSEEQQSTLLTLRNEHRKTAMPLGLEMKAKQAELDVLLVAPQADQTKISAVSAEITALHANILTAKNEYRRNVFEQTGHLPRGGMHGSQKGHAKSGRKAMFHRAAMGDCPRMNTPLANPSE
jgi:hypothetical protein